MSYPAHWEADAVLDDGGTVHLRPIRPDDADLLREFHSRLSPDTVYNRFFTMVRALSAREVERFTSVDHDDRSAVVAILHGQIVGVARYDRRPGTADAEVAVVVEDTHQGRGVGTLLLEHLTSAARERGIQAFIADVLPSNRRMLGVFRSAGFEVRRELSEGYIELRYPIQETEASLEVRRAREHRAEARSVQQLLAPKAVAVVGASRERGTAGHEVFRSLLSHGFEGPAYPVNPAAPHVASVRAYADVRDVPDDIDLAVVAVPAAKVAEVVAACSEKNVRGVVVLSGGFGDAGEEGRARLAELVRLARDGGMRLIGPNAMGVVNTDPSVRLHATFVPSAAPPGRVGVFSQSGALAGTVLAEATRRGLGLSTFVSIGDRADVSGNDLLQYWEDDERTDLVLMHLQHFGNPRKFARIARRLGRRKPVVVLKSGRGTGDAGVEALLASAGVVRADTLSQLFETAQLLALQPLPAGRRIGVVGTSAALGALATDACRAAGLVVPTLPASVREGLGALVGCTESVNPVDLGPTATAEQLDTTLRVVAASGEVDALLVLVTPHTDEAGLAHVLREFSVGSEIPVLASFLGHVGVHPWLAVTSAPDVGPERGSVPSWSSPEAAAFALARAATHAAWRLREPGEVPQIEGIDVDAARAVVAREPLDGTWLRPAAVAELLGAVGLSPVPSRRVCTLDEARVAAGELGWPVALKSADPRWRHRTDVGAVRLDVDEDELAQAWAAIEPFVGNRGAFVQPMAPAGVSTVVRLVEDPAVGPLLSLRLGGVAADLLSDPVTRTLPLTDVDADELVHSIRGVSLLRGTDTAALQDVLHRLARLSEDVPEVAEVVLDPVLVGRRGVTVLHAGARLLPPGVDVDLLPRRLVDLNG